MNEMPPESSVGLISGRLPPAVVQAMPSEMQTIHQNQRPTVVGDLSSLQSGGQQHHLPATGTLLEPGVNLPITTNIEPLAAALNCQPSSDQSDHSQKQQAPPVMFTAASVMESVAPSATSAASTFENSTYKEILNSLRSLWADQKREIEALTDDHWKSQEFPLARIKKIMRMDDDVKMISTEVPVMFSKILEIFITELTMRAWLHTEESKRRTVQRSDIAMAITKHDMFDFLIDIVPREEIQFKTKTQKDGGEGLQSVPPDLLQNYIQQLINQTVMAATGAGGGEEGDEGDAATANTLQQLQLLQQLMQLQQAQQEQPEQPQPQHQGAILDQISPLSQTPGMTMDRHHHQGGHHSEATVLGGVGGGVDVRVLQSSMGTPQAQSTSSPMGSTLEQIAKNGGRCQLNSSDLHQQPPTVLYQTQSSLTQPIGHSENFPFTQQQQQQQHEQQAATYSTNNHAHITTVVIPQPTDTLVHMSQPQPLTSSVLDPSSSMSSFHPPHGSQTAAPHQGVNQDGLRSHLESLATEQFITQQLPVELSSKFGGGLGSSEGGGEDGGGRIDVVEQGALQFQHISEEKSMSRSLSAVEAENQGLTDVIFSTDKQHMVDDVANT